ncbi:hypothetical protein ADL22_07330 [Streptomyces sp. NRRL F-4489]|uniref:SCO2584 family spore wall biosynthesis protein n=1 Tax=Streptomyces sp. NRRL F-4489 TaxID=1609095 RepID=UPI000746B20F|nr:hypothetical protein [Streptomyces sp. NRRL F-4489]KUL50373.1 hypothetical protein ADL22_07330 [Streptomyces sp. NRRL F-4489]
MPDDAGGTPFPDGEEPDEHHHGSHGQADGEFASVVFDEDFVRAATIHEPSAVERMLAAAEARAEAEAAARPGAGFGTDDDYGRDPGARPRAAGDDDPEDDPYGPYGGSLRPYRGTARWHRPMAWVLAVVMGVGLVALAFSAVYRGAAGRGQSPAPPASSSGVDTPPSGAPPEGGPGTLRSPRPGLPPSASAPPRPSFSAGPAPH